MRETDLAFGLVERFARCFSEHSVEDLLRQRIYGIALGCEDLNDHDALRHDQLLATVVGKSDPTGRSRAQERDKGKPLSGKSTLNRLELTGEMVDPSNRYRKIVRSFVEIFLQRHETAPRRMVLDLDATDDPLHGDREGKFFHGYHDAYCYLPLYIFCGSHLLCATLREANIGKAEHVRCGSHRPPTSWPTRCATWAHTHGARSMRHDPAETAQDRRADENQRQARVVRDGLGPSLPGRLCRRA